MSRYQRLLDRLFSLSQSKKMKLGLEVPSRLHELLGSPLESYRSIHIAGTNGKGSVSVKTAEAFRQEGYVVGLFTSPHIATFRERILVDGVMISEEEVVEGLEKLFSIDVDATFFELTTLMALDHFRKKKVEIAVLETGLGGRLDATNIVHPISSIITSIGYDHTYILGDTLEEIASEKAGIIKKNIPVIVGPSVPLEPILKKTDALESPLHIVKDSFDSVEEENRAIARKALEVLGVSESSIVKGLEKRLPCRFELFYHKETSVEAILDVAHNPPGFSALFSIIRKRYPDAPLICLLGISKEKDYVSILSTVVSNASAIHLVEAENGRGMPLQELEAAIRAIERGGRISTSHSSIARGVREALIEAKKLNGILVVCGSFFIMARARRALGIEEPWDHIDMNERL